jgi:hypothetical protein
VIISGLAHPENVLKGRIHLVGWVIALGPRAAGEPAAPHAWARGVTISGPSLSDRQKVPPLTPNIVDVRVQNFQLGAEIER